VTDPTLLVDVGSTVIKVCTRAEADRFSAVERIGRLPGVSPGDHVRALVDQRRRSTGIAAVRICSSANGGVRVGILGLSRRHSVAAAARAAVDAGGNVVYQQLFSAAPQPVPPVDVLVLVGGVDGADHRRLGAAVRTARLADHPHDVLVWAGADAPDVVAGLPVDRQAANVLDRHLRPHLPGLAETIRDIYVRDLVDHKGLRALVDVTDTQIWPTPAVVGLAAERMTKQRIPPAPIAPFVVVDAGGATTDVFVCAELRAEPRARSAPGESIVRHVFTDLGVAASRPGLLHRLADDPDLFDLVSAVAPAGSRALYNAICEGAADALDPPVGFLTCLFLALRRLAAPSGPHGVDLAKAASFVITGGAYGDTLPAAIRRVIDAARGRSVSTGSVLLDREYLLWAYGLHEVPDKPVEG
jgi:MutL protein